MPATLQLQLHPADTRLLVNQAAFAGELVDIPASASVFAACLPIQARLPDVLATFSNLPDDVLVVGDIVNMKILDWQEQEASLDLPFSRSLKKCRGSLVVRPPVEIARAASVIVEELFEGEEFVSVHWRRGDFRIHCPWQGPKHACFFPPRQVRALRQCKELESLALIACHSNASRCMAIDLSVVDMSNRVCLFRVWLACYALLTAVLPSLHSTTTRGGRQPTRSLLLSRSHSF